MIDAADDSAPVSTVENGQIPAGDLTPPELGYQVSIDAFSGPLDLLLYLVRRLQVDIADIPIALIADQFIATVQSWKECDLDMAGDFIVMAATLLEIKSRLIVPPVVGEEGEEEQPEELFDPRTELIQQLLTYRKFKDAVHVLEDLELAQTQRCARRMHEAIPEDPSEIDGMPLENADPYQLFSVWESVLAKIAGLGPRRVVLDDMPIEERINSLVVTMQATREARLSWLFERAPNRIARVGILVATLECVRQGILEALQHEQYGDVYLRFRDDSERNRSAAALPPEEVTDEKRRRRKPPLFTFKASEAATEEAEVLEIEEVIETDEQRFVRELNEACSVDSVLDRVADIEASFTDYMNQKRPQEVIPEVVGSVDTPDPS